MSVGTEDAPSDWTTGRAAITFGRCRACSHRWYFRRGFCPSCGSAEIAVEEASGRGHVYAVTTVDRAPSDALRALAPYRIVLVDAAEGFRLMAHGAPDLAIGDAVAVRFQSFGDVLVPVVERTSAHRLSLPGEATLGNR